MTLKLAEVCLFLLPKMSTEKKLQFKREVFQQCVKLLESRITRAQQAMKEAQDGANSNDKSSAGDKYETSRAMGQLDRDMNAKQLLEAQIELNVLLKLNIDFASDKIISGSMVETNNNIYFIAAGIGSIDLGEQKVIVLSPKSPMAIALHHKTIGETIVFNEKKIEIKNIY